MICTPPPTLAVRKERYAHVAEPRRKKGKIHDDIDHIANHVPEIRPSSRLSLNSLPGRRPPSTASRFSNPPVGLPLTCSTKPHPPPDGHEPASTWPPAGVGCRQSRTQPRWQSGHDAASAVPVMTSAAAKQGRLRPPVFLLACYLYALHELISASWIRTSAGNLTYIRIHSYAQAQARWAYDVVLPEAIKLGEGEPKGPRHRC